MSIYYYEEVKSGMMHDHLHSYTVKFWFTNDEGYRAKCSLWMYIDEGSEDWNKILKVLKKCYKDPDIVSVKYQQMPESNQPFVNATNEILDAYYRYLQKDLDTFLYGNHIFNKYGLYPKPIESIKYETVEMELP